MLKRTKWTPEMEEEVIRRCQTETYAQIAESMGLTQHAVHKKAYKLGAVSGVRGRQRGTKSGHESQPRVPKGARRTQSGYVLQRGNVIEHKLL